MSKFQYEWGLPNWAQLVLCGTSLLAVSAEAQTPTAQPDDGWRYKLTPSYYSQDNSNLMASDLNLRANNPQHTLWLGHYRNSADFVQTRAGYEHPFSTALGVVVPSVQLASMGFVGGSINLQTPGKHFALMGFGRTNLRDYYNLNFDPNDAYTLGLGTQAWAGAVVSIYNTSDNRLQTGQSVTHLVWRQTRPNHRWTVDLSSKAGRPSQDEPEVTGQSLSVAYDHGALFVHAAKDQKVNFSNDTQTRLAVGWRF